MGYDQYTWLCSCRTYFCCFPLALANILSMASPAILSTFFEEQWTQNQPQYLSGLSRALFPTGFFEKAVYKYCKRLSRTPFQIASLPTSLLFGEESCQPPSFKSLSSPLIRKWYTVFINHDCNTSRGLTRYDSSVQVLELNSLCTDAPIPSEKNGERDVCESPSLIVFPCPPECEGKPLIGCNVMPWRK